MIRFFTATALGKDGFTDGCRAISFHPNGFSQFILHDGNAFPTRNCIWGLSDALNNVATGHWIEVSADWVFRTPETVNTTAPVAEGSW